MMLFQRYFCAVLGAFLLLASTFGVAAAGQTPPLVTIRFNQPRVYFDQQLYSAVSKAVAVKPDVTFDLVSLAPATGDTQTDKQWQAVAGHNTRAVIAVMNNIGVPSDRINVTGRSQSGIRFDETQVFVH